MSDKQTISIAGRNYVFEGDLDDPYFRNLGGIAASHRRLEAWARAQLPTDATIIDAGGNIGVTAMLFANLAPHGHVHVFEALPSNAVLLRRNLELNCVANCTVNVLALGHEAGLAIMEGNASSAHIATTSSGEQRVGETVVTTVDAYVTSEGLTRVDFIKIDVEGFEPAVLAGAAHAIARFKPAVYMEFNSWCLSFFHGYSARDFAFRLWRAFDVWTLDSGGSETAAGKGDVATFLHDNAVLHGAIDDILLRLKPNGRVPNLVEPVIVPVDQGTLRRVDELEAELQAMMRSTSWRITAPMRAFSRMLTRS